MVAEADVERIIGGRDLADGCCRHSVATSNVVQGGGIGRGDDDAPLRFADLSEGSLYDLLEGGGLRLSRVTEEVHPVALRAEEANPFGLPSGAPAFAVERLAFSGERPVEHRLVLAPGDRVTLTASWGDLG